MIFNCTYHSKPHQSASPCVRTSRRDEARWLEEECAVRRAPPTQRFPREPACAPQPPGLRAGSPALPRAQTPGLGGPRVPCCRASPPASPRLDLCSKFRVQRLLPVLRAASGSGAPANASAPGAAVPSSRVSPLLPPPPAVGLPAPALCSPQPVVTAAVRGPVPPRPTQALASARSLTQQSQRPPRGLASGAAPPPLPGCPPPPPNSSPLCPGPVSVCPRLAGGLSHPYTCPGLSPRRSTLGSLRHFPRALLGSRPDSAPSQTPPVSPHPATSATLNAFHLL